MKRKRHSESSLKMQKSNTILQQGQHQYTNMNTTMNLAIRHNNHAVDLLQKGFNFQALTEFRKSTKLMYLLTQDIRAKGIVDEPATKKTRCTSPETLYIATGNTFIRSSLLLMRYSDAPTSTCTVESSMILLNMATCYHLDSLRPNGIPRALENALFLYDMVYCLTVQMNDDARSHHIILTALNNMGHIHRECGNIGISQLYCEDLTMYVSFLGREGAPCNVADRREFALNAMVLGNPNTTAAAA
jgi:hypothetical protein